MIMKMSTIVSYKVKNGIDVDNLGHGVVWPRAAPRAGL
jgi:hypothetical protein